MFAYICKYNNYYNRILKVEAELSDYFDYLCTPAERANPIQMVNWIPNDYIRTEWSCPNMAEEADYIVLSEDGRTINSRWFIIEKIKENALQHKAVLRRDLLADYWDSIKSAPTFIEKGFCSLTDPAIYNSENVQVNSIKDREIELKDPTGCSWVVGYCAPKDETETEPTKVEYGSASDVYDFWAPTLNEWSFYQYVNNNNTTPTVKFIDNLHFDFKLNGGSVSANSVNYYLYELKFNKNGKMSFETGTHRGQSLMTVNTENAAEKIYAKIEQGSSIALYNAAKSYYGLSDDVSLYRQLQQFATSANKTKILKVGSGSTAKYYSIQLVASQQSQTDKTPQTNDSLYLAWLTWCQSVGTKTDYNRNSFCTNILSKNYYIKLTETTPTSGLEFYFPWGRKTLKDAPYCMFAIPYGNLDVLYNDNGTGKSFTTDKENALSVAAGIAKCLGKKVYDIQLLPYCPISLIRDGTYPDVVNLKTSPLSSWTINEHYVLIESARQIMFFCEQSTGSFNIDLSGYGLYSFQDTLTFKTNMLTQTLRLCSPNYNGVFEFNVYKNRGLDYINVDYTYKPFQPYIHLNPNFGGLYGKDFNDARGLICGGDFSLPIMSDAWINYQITNKTYQEQFNRQIDNLEVQQNIERKKEKWAVAAGAAGAGMSTAMTSSLYGAGGMVSTAAGVAAGGISLAAGLADIQMNETLRQEALDYKRDMFGLELENIKAQPDSLTRVSAFNANNKIFPFIEFYTATDIEIRAVANKMVYNGYTIGRIDTIENMILNKPEGIPLGYIKGQIIRLDIIDDFHLLNEISSEIFKGVFV